MISMEHRKGGDRKLGKQLFATIYAQGDNREACCFVLKERDVTDLTRCICVPTRITLKIPLDEAH